MTKRGMDDIFEFYCKPRTIIWSLVWALAIVTAIVAYDA